MEWNNGNIRQRPGLKNPMGLVKCFRIRMLFIYTTLYKSLFEFDYRAFSHVYQYGQSQGTGNINSKRGPELDRRGYQ
jgi:hypothetical protein